MSEQMTTIAVDQIQPKDGFNPRRYFDEGDLDALKDSVHEHGILQPIVVRSDDAVGYQVVAGERRWRAARDIGMASIPAVVIDGDDTKALAVAAAENTFRADMSAAEEADAAQRMVAACDGDKAEACRVLGWSRSKLDGRLALLDADEQVRDALAQRQITLGMAELLATLPTETQRGTLAKVVEEGIGKEQIKTKMDAFALHLDTAIFDLTECQTCPHNTGKQANLFSESIGEGRCTNKECFDAKTEQALEAKRAEVATQYNVVWLDKTIPASHYTFLQKTGPNGVGPEQFEQGCQACGQYGAVMVTSPDRLGAVDEGACFDLQCHKAKVAAYQESLKALEGDSTEVSAQESQEDQPMEDGFKKPQGGEKTSGKGGTASANTTPKAVKEASKARVRAFAGDVAQSDAHLGRCATIHALLATLDREGVSLAADSSKAIIAQALGLADSEAIPGLSTTSRAPERIQAFYPYTPEQLDALIQGLGTLLFSGESTNAEAVGMGQDRTANAVAAVAATEADPAEGFQMDADFLGKHTKAGMKAVCQEAGFGDWYDSQHGDGAFEKLMKGKAKELPDQIMAAGFDWTGFVPTSVAEVLRQNKG